MERRIWLIMPIAVLVLAGAALAQPLEDRNEFGLGIVLGEPSGINGQFYWGKHSAVDVTAAWSFHDWFMVTSDFQIYNKIADSPDNWQWYYGLGAYLALPENDDGTFGARVPLGIRYRIPRSVVDIWGEVAPGLRVVPDTEAEVQGESA